MISFNRQKTGKFVANFKTGVMPVFLPSLITSRVCVGETVNYHHRRPPSRQSGRLRRGRSMDGTHSTCVLLDRLPFVDCFGFDLECLLNCGKHLDQLSDLVKTVLTFFDGVHGEMERYFLEAVGDIKSDLATFAVCLAAGR